MLVLSSLPEEIIVRILVLSDPQSIARCQTVCRKLYNLVACSPSLIYILTLTSLGYDLPLMPRSDLTLTDKIELLHKHRLHWLHLDFTGPKKYAIAPDEAQFTVSHYVEGVFARGPSKGYFNRNLEITKTLLFHQLPSENLGIRHKEWSINDLEQGVEEFTIDPGQDLLILLCSPRSANPIIQDNEGYQIYLRTMTENKPHPQATIPVIPVRSPGPVTEEPNSGDGSPRSQYWGEGLQVSGDVLAILFRASSYIQPWVLVWNWCLGIEVACVPMAQYMRPTFTLLSRTMLLTARSKVVGQEDPLTTDTLGAIDAYTFDPDNASIPSNSVRSFALPTLDARYERSRAHIYVKPSRRSMSNSASNGRDRPKVYSIPLQDGLVTFNVFLHTNERINWPGHLGMLCVPFSVFSDADCGGPTFSASQTHNTHAHPPNHYHHIVPWDQWGHHTTWIQPAVTSASEHIVVGHRLTMTRHARSSSPVMDLFLFDFNQRRLRWRELAARKSNEDAASVVITEPRPEDDGAVLGRALFCKGDASGLRKNYTVTQVPIEIDYSFFVDMIVDDERVVIIHQAEEIGEGSELVVYDI